MVYLEVENAQEEANRLKAQAKRIVFDTNVEDNFGFANFIHPKSMNWVQLEIFRPEGVFKK